VPPGVQPLPSWPEGFMRSWYSAAIQFPQTVVVTPSLVHIEAGVADKEGMKRPEQTDIFDFSKE